MHCTVNDQSRYRSGWDGDVNDCLEMQNEIKSKNANKEAKATWYLSQAVPTGVYVYGPVVSCLYIMDIMNGLEIDIEIRQR